MSKASQKKRNAERAEWALVAVEAFASETGLDTDEDADGLDTAIGDLLGDLMHLCDVEEIDFGRVLDTAQHHYDCERIDDTLLDLRDAGLNRRTWRLG